MEFKVKQYSENNGKTRKYIEYKIQDEDEEKIFNNAEYFEINIDTDTFENIMSGTGGFCANVTTRLIKNKKLKDIVKISLFCIPQEYNDLMFVFIYIDRNNKIQHIMYDDNYFDYEYFKNKFADCIINSGFIYELEDNETYKDLFKEVCFNPSAEFKYTVEGKNIKWGDSFETDNLDILTDNVKKKLSAFCVEKIIFTLYSNPFDFINLEGKFLLNDGSYLSHYQYWEGVKTKEEFFKKMEDEGVTLRNNYVDDSIYTFYVPFSPVVLDKLSFIKNNLVER